MAKLKMLKLPKKPKLGKKPKQTASLQVKQGWINRKSDLSLKWQAKCNAVKKENEKRQAINDASEKASTVIAGIGDITEVRPSRFTSKLIRAPRKSKRISGVKKHRKTAKKKAASRRRR